MADPVRFMWAVRNNMGHYFYGTEHHANWGSIKMAKLYKRKHSALLSQRLLLKQCVCEVVVFRLTEISDAEAEDLAHLPPVKINHNLSEILRSKL